MAVKIESKSKSKSKESTEAALSEKVDRIGLLKAAIDDIDPMQKELKKLRNDLIDLTEENHDLGEKVAYEGDEYTVTFSAGTMSKFIGSDRMKELHDRLGDTFYELVQISATDAGKYLSGIERDEFITEVRSKVRRMAVAKKD